MFNFKVKVTLPTVMFTTGFVMMMSYNLFVICKLTLSTHRSYLHRIRLDLTMFEQMIHEINTVLDSEEVRRDPEVAMDRHPFLSGRNQYLHPSLLKMYDLDLVRCRRNLRRALEVLKGEWRALAVDEMMRR